MRVAGQSRVTRPELSPSHPVSDGRETMDDQDPFATPSASLDPDLPPVDLPSGPYGAYRNNDAIARVVVALVLVFSGAIPTITSLVNIAIYAGHPLAATTPAQFYLKALDYSSVPMLATFVCFGIWIVRAAKNAHLFAMVRRKAAVGTPDKAPVVRDTPGWAVGWYFIPIASLWRPYTAMKDVFVASDTRSSAPGYLLPTWWTLWLLSMFSDNSVQASDATESLAGAVTIVVVAGAVTLGLAIIAAQLVRTLTRMQQEAAVDLTETWQSLPPAPETGVPPNSVEDIIRRSTPEPTA